MAGTLIGYARCSTDAQDLTAQRDRLREHVADDCFAMTLTSTEESRRRRSVAERVLQLVGALPVTCISGRRRFWTIRYSPGLRCRPCERRTCWRYRLGPAAPLRSLPDDVAGAVAAVLVDPADRIGAVYELTGPESLDIDGLAAHYARGLHRPITGTDVAHDTWVEEVLAPLGLPAHLQQHIATMARLHREGRYDRATDDVEKLTGKTALTVEQYIIEHPGLFS